MTSKPITSRPLYDESEEERRRREVARKYLSDRAAFEESRKPGYSADISDLDTTGMSNEQIDAERYKRLQDVETNFQQSVLDSNNTGFNNEQQARDYLNRGQARIVGDTVVGSASGISADKWDNNLGDPKSLIPKKDMVEVSPGVSMDQSTLDRTNQSILASNAAKSKDREARDAGVKKTQESIRKMWDEKKERDSGDTSPEAGQRRYKSFVEARKQRESLGVQARQELELNRESYRNARLVDRAMRTALRRYQATNGREGALVDPDRMEKATANLRDARIAMGPNRNSEDRLRYVRNRILGKDEEELSRERRARGNPFLEI